MPIRDYRIIVDTPAKQARLGFEGIADALAQSIAQSTPRFAVGIFGPWGSGKTTLMQAVRGKLQPFQTIAVDFSAWRYEKEEHLLVPLLDTIREAMVEWVDVYATIAPAVEPAPVRDQVKEAVLDTAKTVGKVITSLVAGLSLKVGLPGALDLSFEANKALTKHKELSAPVVAGAPADTRTDLQRQVARRSEPDFPQSIYHGCFRELTRAFETLRTTLEAIRPASDIRFVVFVDDLDRCLPQGALEVLEAIKLFFETEGFVFVVGLDRSIVERFIEQRYVQPQGWTTTSAAGGTLVVVPEKRAPLVSGADYIKKIFQVPYTLAPVQLSQLTDLLEGIATDGKLPPDQADDLRQRVARHLRVALSDAPVNPREVKRYINAYVMQMKIRPTLDPDVVLALQTMRARPDWEKVDQALAVHRGELLTVLAQVVREGQSSGGPVSLDLLAALNPELANLPGPFLEYVTDGAGEALIADATADRIDEYLYSIESAGTTHGAVLLDLLPILFQARAAIEHATLADAPALYSAAQAALRRGLSVIGNLEGFPAVRELAAQIDRVGTTLVAPSTAELDSGEAGLNASRAAVLKEITAMIQRTRTLRRTDRLEAMNQA